MRATCPHCDAAEQTRAICTACAGSVTICGGVRLGGEIDRGGVARIHDATTSEGQIVAVKVLDRTPIHSSAVHRLFARSARFLSTMSHPALPSVRGFETNRRRSFLVMERLDGGTLWSRVAQGKVMRGATIDALLRRLLEGIAYLHARDLVHGDVTPRNVMFRTVRDDQPVLVDFDGLCTTTERDVASLVMTPGYTAPEQRVGELGPGSDLFGVGATMVFAATGKAPDRLDRIGEHLDVDLSRADLSETTRALLQRLVAIDPQRRPKSAQAALETMEDATKRAVAVVRRTSWRTSRSKKVAPLALLAAVLTLLVFALAFGVVALASIAPARPM